MRGAEARARSGLPRMSALPLLDKFIDFGLTSLPGDGYFICGLTIRCGDVSLPVGFCGHRYPPRFRSCFFLEAIAQ